VDGVTVTVVEAELVMEKVVEGDSEKPAVPTAGFVCVAATIPSIVRVDDVDVELVADLVDVVEGTVVDDGNAEVELARVPVPVATIDDEDEGEGEGEGEGANGELEGSLIWATAPLAWRVKARRRYVDSDRTSRSRSRR
jgi:hypothetical protein